MLKAVLLEFVMRLWQYAACIKQRKMSQQQHQQQQQHWNLLDNPIMLIYYAVIILKMPSVWPFCQNDILQNRYWNRYLKLARDQISRRSTKFPFEFVFDRSAEHVTFRFCYTCLLYSIFLWPISMRNHIEIMEIIDLPAFHLQKRKFKNSMYSPSQMFRFFFQVYSKWTIQISFTNFICEHSMQQQEEKNILW